MNQPDQKESVDKLLSGNNLDTPTEPSHKPIDKLTAEIVETTPKKESIYHRFIKNMRKSVDADLFYTMHVKDALGKHYDQKKEGLFKRLNTYLFQYSHYTHNIKKDIQSHNNSLNLYLAIYAFGLVLIPCWLTYMEFNRVLNGESLAVSLLFLIGYMGIIGYGFYRIVHTMYQKKHLQNSLINLYIHGISVLNASNDYNIRLLRDKNYGTTHGFDDGMLEILSLDGLTHNEYHVIKKSYQRHYLENPNFDYANLTGIIRAHQALYNTVIKGDLNNLNKEQADQVFDTYETAIKKLHQIHISRFKQLIKVTNTAKKSKPLEPQYSVVADSNKGNL